MAKKDLTGLRFGRLTVLEFDHRENTTYYWKCKCDCGVIKLIDIHSLRKGNTKSCGSCMKTNRTDLEGRRFGRLIAINYNIKCGKWHCQCDCGGQSLTSRSTLINGRAISCGCYHRERQCGSKKYAHIDANATSTPEYRILRHIKSRCQNHNVSQYSDYGGRGITVCDRWKDSFENFYADMGARPSSKHSIDRIDNNKGYCKENCRWATRKEQNNNKRDNIIIEYNNKKQSLKLWCEELNLPYKTIYARFKYLKWSAEKAFNEPIHLNRGRNKEPKSTKEPKTKKEKL